MQPSDYFFVAFVLSALLLAGLALYRWVVRISELEFALGIFIITVLAELFRYFGPLLVWNLASGTPIAVRYWIWRGLPTVQGVAPLLLVAAVWLLNHQGFLNRFHFYLALTASICSGLFIAWSLLRALEPYYPRYSAFMLAFYYADPFALAGAVIPVVLSIAVLRKARPRKSIAQPVRRASSALHGESNWFPIEQARRWFAKGGIVNRRGLPPRPQSQTCRQGSSAPL
jgi:hypothetical protein